MSWLRLAFKEWVRRPVRTGITAAGIAIAVAALYSLLSFQRGYRTGVRQELDRLGAHVLVVPKGCPYDAASIALHGASWPCYLKARYLIEVQGTPGVDTAAPVLMSAFFDREGHQSVFVGVDEKVLRLKPHWKITGAFPKPHSAQEPVQLLAGRAVADRLRWQVGSEVRLDHLNNAHAIVTGILSATQGSDDAFIFLNLPDAQTLLRRPEQLTHILVRLKDPNDLDRVVSQLRGCDAGLFMNVVPLAHMFRTIQSIVRSTRWLLGAIALIALLVAAAGVSNSVLMSVAERTREIGVLRALGASRAQIFALFWFETLQVCFVGAICGVLMAYLSSHTLEQWLRAKLPFAPTDSLVVWESGLGAACILLALIVGSAAGFLPAWRAALLSPIEAIRQRET